MALTPGTRLGPYEISAPLGAGGMGEVYKATDTRLDRTVAIKVLPEHVAGDPELRARFEREAKTLASLSHPHICPIHDVGSQDGTDFLVMEYLEGETLAQRLEEGPLPLDQALGLAVEIADALDKAHRQGIVHRDLKPGNVMLTRAGAKLLDFGLAKLRVTPAGSAAVSAAPTVTSPLTGEGSIVGTFQYMAPEQLEGQEADPRTDIFAFGAVVYEMLTGRRAFEGKSQAGLIGAIMHAEPPAPSSLDASLPDALDRVLAVCLSKNADNRWQSLADVGRQLAWAREMRGQAREGASGVAEPVPRRQRLALRLLVGALGAIAAAALFFAGGILGGRAQAGPVSNLVMAMPEGLLSLFGGATQPQFDISPDGRSVVFVGRSEDGSARSQLYLRHLDDDQVIPVAGSGGANNPTFSPDGEWIAFSAFARSLMKIPAAGGAPTQLADIGVPTRGISWRVPDWIVYATSRGNSLGLSRISSSGGQPQQLLSGTPGREIRWPYVLDDGRHVLFSSGRGRSATSSLELLDIETGERRELIQGGTMPRLTASGHLVFARAGDLVAVPFDSGRLEVTSTAPLTVQQGVAGNGATGAFQWAVSNEGTFVYQTGAPGGRLLWATDETLVQAVERARTYYDPRIAPDGRRVAVEVVGTDDEIVILDLDRGSETRLSFDVAEDETPVWSPDGEWVVWSADRDSDRAILRKRATGSGSEDILWRGVGHVHVGGFSPGGTHLVFDREMTQTGSDIWMLSLDANGEPDGAGGEPARALVETEFQERSPALSPDGRWMAYVSDKNGVDDVFVGPFPGLDSQWVVSTNGGEQPVWSADSRQLFYRGGGSFWAVEVEVLPNGALRPGTPRPLFDDRFDVKGFGHTSYAVARDGRFLVVGTGDIGQQGRAEATAIRVILNWFTTLAERVPGS